MSIRRIVEGVFARPLTLMTGVAGILSAIMLARGYGIIGAETAVSMLGMLVMAVGILSVFVSIDICRDDNALMRVLGVTAMGGSMAAIMLGAAMATGLTGPV